MFSFFTSAETHVVRAQENADLKKRIKSLEETIESNEKRFAKREAYLEEKHEDEMRVVKRTHKRELENAEDEHEDEIRELNSDHRDEVEELKRDIASLIRDSEENATNVKLAIKEAELKLKEGHMDEVTDILRKLNLANAQTLVAQADGKAQAAEGEAKADALEGVLETVGDLADFYQETAKGTLDTLKSIAPKVDLSKMEVNVNVPTTQGGNKGGDQKKQ